jgi:hypothetical protein
MFVETVFLAEILFTCFVGRYKEFRYLGNLRDIAGDYLGSGQLAFDLFTSIPIAWIEYLQRLQWCTIEKNLEDSKPDTSMLRMVKLIKPLRLLRLLRMLKMFNHKMFKALKDSMAVEPEVIRLLSIAVGVFTCCHFTGCLFWLVKQTSYDTEPEKINDFLVENNFKKLWFCSDELPEGYEECERTDNLDVYIMCFYFSMTTLTTVGYGDIGGTNSTERMYVCCLQIFGTVVFATIMNQLSMVLDNLTHLEQEREFRMTKCRKFLSKHFIDEKLARAILDWAAFEFTSEMEWTESKDIMQILPETMRMALALSLHENRLSVIPLFFQAGHDFIAEVSLALVPERYNSGEKVVTAGTFCDRMYVVYLGSCMMSLHGRHISIFAQGDYFGEANLLEASIQRTNVICSDFSELWCMEKSRLDSILLRFPKVKKSFKALASDDSSRKASSCAPLAGMQLGNGLLRPLSVEYDLHGVRLPITDLVDHEDDAVAILRWSFMVTRIMRKIYAQDATVRIVVKSTIYTCVSNVLYTCEYSALTSRVY